MTQEQRFLNWYKQRRDEALERWHCSMRIDESGRLVITQSWPSESTTTAQALGQAWKEMLT
jgi:hypothetical protein